MKDLQKEVDRLERKAKRLEEEASRLNMKWIALIGDNTPEGRKLAKRTNKLIQKKYRQAEMAEMEARIIKRFIEK